jgi:hypothetical protein
LGGVLFGSVQAKHRNCLFRYRTETNCFETNQKQTETTLNLLKNTKICSLSHCFGCLLFVLVQSKHRNSLFRYKTETNVLFRIVPKLVSVPIVVVSNRNCFEGLPIDQWPLHFSKKKNVQPPQKRKVYMCLQRKRVPSRGKGCKKALFLRGNIVWGPPTEDRNHRLSPEEGVSRVPIEKCMGPFSEKESLGPITEEEREVPERLNSPRGLPPLSLSHSLSL